MQLQKVVVEDGKAAASVRYVFMACGGLCRASLEGDVSPFHMALDSVLELHIT